MPLREGRLKVGVVLNPIAGGGRLKRHWPDVAASWISPESVIRRAEWCQAFANRLPDSPDPLEIAAASLGDALPEETMQAIRLAPDRRIGLALLLASPEFQRR